MTALKEIFAQQQMDYRHNPYLAIKQRRQLLQQLKSLLQQNASKIAAAISSDFGYRVESETLFLEIYPTINAINYCLSHLNQWVKKRKRHVSWHFLPARAYLLPQPLGVVGIISPWNYPVFLTIIPLAYALAAGNRVMVNMSEYSPQTAALLDSLLQELKVPASLVKIMQGNIDFAKEFGSLPFNHLLFTGSTNVGKQVMAAAAANLTPVTLELGGKSPTIISTSVDRSLLKRVFMGKLYNAGQTCVAPDYLLVAKGLEPLIEEAFAEFIKQHFPQLPNNLDYSTLISAKHVERMQQLLQDAEEKGARLVKYGEQQQEGKFPACLVFNVAPSMQLMQHEIFGPLLPVMTYENIDEAIAYINARPHPLALYYFGNNKEELNKIQYLTLSGALVVNQTIMHTAVNDLPFGGVGHSGMGQYHGKEGFDVFSQLKPVMIQNKWSPLSWFYPPYGKLMRFYLKHIGKIK